MLLGDVPGKLDSAPTVPEVLAQKRIILSSSVRKAAAIGENSKPLVYLPKVSQLCCHIGELRGDSEKLGRPSVHFCQSQLDIRILISHVHIQTSLDENRHNRNKYKEIPSVPVCRLAISDPDRQVNSQRQPIMTSAKYYMRKRDVNVTPITNAQV
jgi:hypothetical protein